jgi:hypothetical protein
MKKTIISLFTMISFVWLTGCVTEATQPMAVQEKKVPLEVFSAYNCDQLRSEYRRLNNVARDMETELKSRADKDENMTDLWLVTGIQLGAYKYGDGPLTEEYAEAKGNLTAMRINMIEKDCTNLPW